MDLFVPPFVLTTELRATDNPLATAATPDPDPDSNQPSVAGVELLLSGVLPAPYKIQ